MYPTRILMMQQTRPLLRPVPVRDTRLWTIMKVAASSTDVATAEGGAQRYRSPPISALFIEPQLEPTRPRFCDYLENPTDRASSSQRTLSRNDFER